MNRKFSTIKQKLNLQVYKTLENRPTATFPRIEQVFTDVPLVNFYTTITDELGLYNISLHSSAIVFLAADRKALKQLVIY